jgi:hypothetical protein
MHTSTTRTPQKHSGQSCHVYGNSGLGFDMGERGDAAARLTVTSDEISIMVRNSDMLGHHNRHAIWFLRPIIRSRRSGGRRRGRPRRVRQA